MEKPNILLVGGGGHCHSVIECLERSGHYNIIGVSDLPERLGEDVLGYRIITTDKNIPSLEYPFECIITIGQIKSPLPRIEVYNFLLTNKIKLTTIIDSDAIVSKRATIGAGTVILRQSFINSGVSIGDNCIINSRAMIEHDSIIGNHVHVSTGAIINGNCNIGDGCFIGSGAVISNGVSVKEGTLIGAGCVVLQDVTISGTYLGNPARRIK